jgi:uncharacterized protein (DUF1697 family)
MDARWGRRGQTGAMERRVLLIRAINVGGTAKLPMADLRDMLGALGATDVVTYIASGNVVLSVPGDPATFDRAVESALEARFGWWRDVISRSPQQMRAAREAHPFEVIEPKFSYVSFLTRAPTAEAISAAEELPTGDDRWRVIGDELHLRYAAGAGQPQLNTDALHRRLGVAGTARNLTTVEKLIALSR